MSYILDALRRAEAQRSRGAVPTLHAPMLDAGLLSPTDARSPGRGWWLALVLAGVAVLIGLAVWVWRAGLPQPDGARSVASAGGQADLQPLPAAPAASAVANATVNAVPIDPAVAAMPAPAPAPAPAPSSTLPAVSNAGSPPAMAAPSISALEPMQTPTSRAPPPPARAAPGLAPAPVPSSSRQPSAARQNAPAPGPVAAPETGLAPATRPTESPVVQRRDLPAELQRELPALAVSGMVYSADRAQRIVIVNGELLHEGDRMGPELVLEEIRRKDAVLRYKGQRFSIGP